MGFNSFINTQFNNTKFYVTTSMRQPDIYNSGELALCEQPILCISLRDFFRSEIDAAIAGGTSWSSGIYTICKCVKHSPSETTRYINVQVEYTGSQLRVRMGLNTSATSLQYSETYNKNNDAPLNIYLIKYWNRYPMTAEGSPNWTSESLYAVIDQISVYAGTWNAPSSAYPYGHMVYSWDRYDYAYNCAYYRASACNENDSTRGDQPLEFIEAYNRIGFDSVAHNDIICMGLDNNYNPDDPGPQPPTPDDPNDEGDPSDEGGGDGDHTPIYDPIPIPGKPTQGAATAGFVTLYKLHQAAMTQFADDMFANNLWEALKQFFGTPMDFMIGVNLLPFEPTAGPSYKPAFGPTAVFGHAYPTVANQYVDIDCGSITITKYWGSCFDYEPYTKIQIWLPYIGYRDLPVDEIMGSTINVKYRCDCLTGDCVAFVSIGVVGETGPQIPRVIGQYYGNCAVRVPFGSSSYDQAISNSITLMGAAATSGLSAAGGALMETGGAIGGSIAAIEGFGSAMATTPGTANSAMGVVAGTKPNIHKGGAAGASTGYMSIQVPYIIRRIPRQNLPSNYKDLKGYPSNIGGTLADFTGLAVVDDIQLNDIPALEDERKEIIAWLRGGVLL